MSYTSPTDSDDCCRQKIVFLKDKRDKSKARDYFEAREAKHVEPTPESVAASHGGRCAISASGLPSAKYRRARVRVKPDSFRSASTARSAESRLIDLGPSVFGEGGGICAPEPARFRRIGKHETWALRIT